ncbi:MAG: hypothetical protein JNJ86_02685, partial [Chitinophagaceae bacterium]|nr:hypothetical protein [Chitinophagaceae bacterium]
RRTVVSYKDLLIGRDEFLVPLLQAAVVVKSAKYTGKTDVLRVVLENSTSNTIVLQNKTGFTFHTDYDVITLQPGDNNILEIKTKQRLAETELKFEVLSAANAPGHHPRVSWKVKVGE